MDSLNTSKIFSMDFLLMEISLEMQQIVCNSSKIWCSSSEGRWSRDVSLL